MKKNQKFGEKKLFNVPLLKILSIINLIVVLVCFMGLSGIAGNYLDGNLKNPENLSNPSTQQAKKITGKVTDSKGATLPGVSVLVKGTTTGVITDVDGNYTLSNVSETSILVYSFVGMRTNEIKSSGKTVINVVMEDETIGLEEVVAIGYGTRKRSDVTGSVSSMKSEDIKKLPITRVAEALQGSATGVSVTSSGGQPGSTMRVRVRGVNSINGNNDPLYIIDGFLGGNIDGLNLNDIEAMEVLKDASATAIYGSRGSNGVILVTTKSGKAGDTKVEFEANLSINSLPKKLDLMNAFQFASSINSMSKVPPFSDSQIATFKTQSTDWQNELYRNAYVKNYQLSIRGGNKDIRYFISGNYSDQPGIMLNSGWKKSSLRSNIDVNLTKKLSVKLNLTANETNGHNNSWGGFKGEPESTATLFSPLSPVYDTSGNYNILSPYGSILRNPVAMAQNAQFDRILDNFEANMSLNYAFSNDLKLTVNAGIVKKQGVNRSVNNLIMGATVSAAFEQTRQNIFQNSNILTYSKVFNDIHSLNLSAVYEQQTWVNDNNTGSSAAMTTAALGYYGYSLGTQALAANYNNEALQSFLGRVNYSLMNKYLLTLSARSDGSSKFADGNRYSVFPSLALAWKASEEQFIKSLGFINDLKVRASWGKTGNQAISPYSTLTLLNTSIGYPLDGNAKTPAAIVGAPGNDKLKWETTSTVNAGLDASLLKNRLFFSFDAYQKTTSDLLLKSPLSQYVGGGTYLNNVGSVSNKGIEVTLGGIPLVIGDFKWKTSVNLSINRNKILDLGKNADGSEINMIASPNGYFAVNVYEIVKGQPLGILWGLKSLGTWKSSEAADAAKFGLVPGNQKFEDLNNDGMINQNDYQNLGCAQPKYTASWSNDFSYKNWTLNVFVVSTQGQKTWNANRLAMFGGQLDNRSGQATTTEFLNHWTPTNETNIPTDNTQTNSSMYAEDASFIKLRNISLSYNVPNTLLSKFKIKSLSLNLSGQNLLTITKYKGYDPESYTIYGGAGSDDAGTVDWGTVPNPRSFTMGVRIGF